MNIFAFIVVGLCFYAAIVFTVTQLIDTGHQVGVLFNLKSVWIGIHFSRHNHRVCVNIASQSGA